MYRSLQRILGKEKLIDTINLDSSTIERYWQALNWSKSFRNKKRGGKRVVAPTLIFEVNCNFSSSVDPLDGSYKSLQDIGKYSRIIRASNDYEIVRYLTEGDEIRVYRTFDRLYTKETKKGRSMIFLDSTLKYFDRQNNIVGINHESMILIPKKKV